MKKITILPIATALSLLLFIFSCGDKKKENIDKEGLTKTHKDKNGYSYQTVEGDMLKARIYTLANGLKVYLTDNKDAPRLQTMIAVRAGSSYDPKATTGLAHYLEHMVFKGTSKIASLDWEKEKPLLQEISDLYEAHKNEPDAEKKKLIYAKIDSVSGLAAKYVAANEYDKMITSIGAKGTNAFTSHEMTVYINDIPANELDHWLSIESERFSELTLRLFHTELEAVYEEFNMGQDNDDRKSWKATMSGLFKKHPYGTQTTIGKAEHIKNPSLVNIHNYWSTYYVPNNMAVIISGDLDFDKTIKVLDHYFGKFKTKEVPESHRPTESPITTPVVKEVLGPDAENLLLSFRFDAGEKSTENLYVTLIDMILTNGKAGLIDLDINQKQKALRAGSYTYFLREYGIHTFYGTPREGQTLEELKALILAEIEKVKKGEFEDWMLEAAVNNLKLDAIKAAESNYGRCNEMLSSFIYKVGWETYVTFNENIAKLTKKDIVEFANKHYKNNYVLVYKRTGEDKSVSKVEKPTITPVEINRKEESKFASSFFAQKTGALSPMFLDFKNDIKSAKTKSGIEVKGIKNTENDLFQLNYVIEMGKDNMKELDIAMGYLKYLGTNKYTAEELKKEFYKLGISMNVYTGNRRSYIFIKGLQKSMEKGVELFEHVLANVKPDSAAYQKYVAGIIKKRKDSRLDKYTVMYEALSSYGTFGSKNSFTSKLSEKELLAMNPAKLTDLLKGLYSYQHSLFYYGNKDLQTILPIIEKNHTIKGELKEVPERTNYVELETNKNMIYFVNYDMVQNWVMLISKGDKFDKTDIPNAELFGEFYGSGLSSVIFQEIRESKALAYSAYASFRVPRYPEQPEYLSAFAAVQADKMPTAVASLKALLNEMPEAEKQFELAKEGIIKKIQSERITKANIFWTYMYYKDRGIDYDIRKDTYKFAQATNMDEFKTFFDKKIANKKYTMLVMGKKELTNMAALRKMGTVKELTLDQIFGH